MSLCQTNSGDRRFSDITQKELEKLNTKLPDNVYYVYITTSKPLVKNSRNSGHPVILVGREDLNDVLRDLWGAHRSDFLREGDGVIDE